MAVKRRVRRGWQPGGEGAGDGRHPVGTSVMVSIPAGVLNTDFPTATLHSTILSVIPEHTHCHYLPLLT